MKSVIYSLIALTILSSVFAVAPAYAQQSTDMTDEHIARIKSSCLSARGTLTRIRANDALTYVNANQVYFSVSDKLIAHLNGRLALNRYDTTQLVKIATEYNKSLANFRGLYAKYDDAVAELIRMDCTRQPVAFYDKVADVRQQRQSVRESVQKLQDSIDQYRQGVQTFQLQQFPQTTGGSNE